MRYYFEVIPDKWRLYVHANLKKRDIADTPKDSDFILNYFDKESFNPEPEKKVTPGIPPPNVK